jgi:hypothetical protein
LLLITVINRAAIAPAAAPQTMLGWTALSSSLANFKEQP